MLLRYELRKEDKHVKVSLFPGRGTKSVGNSQGPLFRLGSADLRTGYRRYESQGQYFRQGSGFQRSGRSLPRADRLIKGVGT